jgi:hypothetical protein
MLDKIATTLMSLLQQLASLVFAALAWIEAQLGILMTAAHIPHGAQVILGVVLAVLFLVAAFQLFSGFIRIVLIVFLVALLAHAMTVKGDTGIPHLAGPPAAAPTAPR